MANLDPTVTKALNTILEKDLSELTDYDKSFLRARSAYLSRGQKSDYAEVLNPPKKELKQEVKDQKKAEKEKAKASEQSKKDQNEHLEPIG